MHSEGGGAKNRDSFVLPWTYKAIKRTRGMLPYGIVSKQVLGQASPSFFFVDVWVLAHLFLAGLGWLLQGLAVPGCLIWTLCLYGTIRVIEIVVYNLDVMLGDPLTAKPYKLRSLRRSLLLAGCNYAEVLLWFAAIYRTLPKHFGADVHSATDSFYLSALTMATYGDIDPRTSGARWIVAGHLLVSLFLTLGVLARLVSVLPRPKSMDDDEAAEA